MNDFWASHNAAFQNLNQAISDINTQNIAEDKQQRANKLSDLQMQSTSMDLAEKQRQLQVDAGARQAVTAAQTGPVAADGTAPKVDADRILLDYYRQNDPAKAAGMEKLLTDKFKALSEIDPEHAITWYNGVSGQNLKYAGKKGDYSIVHTADGTIVAVNTKNPSDMQVIQQGTPKLTTVPNDSTVIDSTGKVVLAPKADGGGFQSAIAGLTGPSKAGSLYSIGNTAVKTGYAPMAEVESDIRMAGADYGAKANDIDKAVDNARSLYKDTYVQGPRTKPKGSKSGYTPEYNLLGQQKDVGKTTDVNVSVNNGGGDEADVAAWAKAVKEGRATLQDVPNRGTVRSRVVKALENEGGVDYAAKSADNKAYSGSLAQQEKQRGAMGSFVKNIDKQVNRFKQISSELYTFDSRLLNVPLRALRGRVEGSPLQSKVDMYLTEISSETGKLASGATGSVAELSQGAREKWEKIHDPNLSMKDLISILEETRHAGQMRLESVDEGLKDTRSRRSGSQPAGKTSSRPLPKF